MLLKYNITRREFFPFLMINNCNTLTINKNLNNIKLGNFRCKTKLTILKTRSHNINYLNYINFI